MQKQITSYLIVGLGNPGKKYEATRHNLGFLTIDQLLNLLPKETNQQLKFTNSAKLKSKICQFNYKNKKIILAKPQTFVNLSGEAVKLLKNWYKPQQILIIYDDLNLTLGTIRLRFNGKAGGHKGVENIIKNITPYFWRLKLGIGPKPKNIKAETFVLQKINKNEEKIAKKMAEEAIKSILIPNIIKNPVKKLNPITIRTKK